MIDGEEWRKKSWPGEMPMSPNDWMKKEELWLNAAVVTAMIVFIFLIWVGIAVFFGTQGSDRIGAVDMLYKVGLLGAAVVTFLTVVWRGLLATKQVDAQMEQIAALREQIAANAAVHIAQQLREGTELIIHEHAAKQRAGIASLQSVALGTSESYAGPALDVVAQYVQEKGASKHIALEVKAAISVINSVFAATGRAASIALHFKTEDDESYWHLVKGARRVFYSGGAFANDVVPNARGYRFQNVTFDDCEINGDFPNFVRCKFVDCRITSIKISQFSTNEFEGCDFSGARMVQLVPRNRAIAIKGSSNFFRQGREPVDVGRNGHASPMDWKAILEERDEQMIDAPAPSS